MTGQSSMPSRRPARWWSTSSGTCYPLWQEKASKIFKDTKETKNTDYWKALLRTVWWDLLNICCLQVVHYDIVAYPYRKQLRNLPTLITVHFSYYCLPHCFPQYLQLVFHHLQRWMMCSCVRTILPPLLQYHQLSSSSCPNCCKYVLLDMCSDISRWNLATSNFPLVIMIGDLLPVLPFSLEWQRLPHLCTLHSAFTSQST